MSELFEKRLKSWYPNGQLSAFNLACVAEALDTVKMLHDQNVGGEEVEQRVGEFKSWDPEIFKVDKDTENGFIARLKERGEPFVFLSEEAGRVEINLDKSGEKRYVVCDPFDGSYLFKHGIPDFWYSSLAFYNANLSPLSCAVGDCVARKIAFANERGSFLVDLDGSNSGRMVKLDKHYRESMGRPDVTDLEIASIESYALKPKKFLMPLVDEYRDLFLQFKFFLPNGGPYGFVDVAEGKIDCYFARQQPYMDVLSGIYISEQAELVVTDFEGNEVKPSDDLETLWDVLVTSNKVLHEKVLSMIAEGKKKKVL